MKKILSILILSMMITSAYAKEKQIEVTSEDVQDIEIKITGSNFVSIQLDNEIKGFVKLGLNSIQAEQLNNKTIVLYPYDRNLPQNLGKVILTDKYCNKYALNLSMDTNAKNEGKDRVIHISNPNKEGNCEAIENKNTFPKLGAVLYKDSK